MSQSPDVSGSVVEKSGTGTGGRWAVTELLINSESRGVVVAGVIVLALLPFGYAFRWSVGFGDYYLGGFRVNGFFYLLALLPGVAAIIDHVLRTRYRRGGVDKLIREFKEKRDPVLVTTRTSPGTSTGTGDGGAASLTPGIAAAIFLTAVFLFVAALADREIAYTSGMKLRPVDGIVFCGLGAYVSMLYYLGARMYANAISSSFLLTSALRSASAIAFGWAAVSIGMLNALPQGTTQVGALFMSGLFFSWAIGALRAKAMTWFGAPKTDNEELPLGIVKGIEDTTADQLQEHGITTIQHLAETDPADLCNRALLPLNRVINWVNQAILISKVERNIVALRAAGKGTATELARCYALAQAGDPIEAEVMKSLGAKTVGDETLKSIAASLLDSKTVQFFYTYLEGEGKELKASRESLQTIVEGRLQIKAQQPTVPATPPAKPEEPQPQPEPPQP